MPDYELEDLEIPDGSAPATRLQKKIERQKYKDEHPEVKPKEVSRYVDGYVDWMIMRCIRNTDRHCDMNRHCDYMEYRSALRYWNVPGTALNVKVHEM